MPDQYYCLIASPLGELLLMASDAGLSGLYMSPHSSRPDYVTQATARPDHAVLSTTTRQLQEYFGGQRKQFDLPLAAQGSEFQKTVWQALMTIPYGKTCSYGALAQKIGSPKAARAVGLANGRNPISIIVPCHRVIGADGSMTGYGGGVPNKRFLLNLEGALPEATISHQQSLVL